MRFGFGQQIDKVVAKRFSAIHNTPESLIPLSKVVVQFFEGMAQLFDAGDGISLIASTGRSPRNACKMLAAADSSMSSRALLTAVPKWGVNRVRSGWASKPG